MSIFALLGTDFSGYVPIVVALVGTSGLLGGIYALLKLRPEAGQITVSAAQGAVIVQSGVIESLRDENTRLQERVTALESAQRETSDLYERIEALSVALDEARRLNEQLSAELRECQRSNAALSIEVNELKQELARTKRKLATEDDS